MSTPRPKVNGHTHSIDSIEPSSFHATGDQKESDDLEELSSFESLDKEREFMPPGIGRRSHQDDDKILQLLEQIASQKDKTALPNWLMPIIVGLFVALLGFVYTTMDRRIEDYKKDARDQVEKLERRLDTQETFTKNSREKLIENGWTFTDDGKIIKRK